MNETYMILFLMAYVGFMGFMLGGAWESGRERREAKREAVRRLTNEIMLEKSK
jgi:hypothetical protein